MIASRIEARAVFKVVAVVLAALAVALLLQHVVIEIRTTIRWLFAAIFLALALHPLVALFERPIGGRSLPRWLAILVAYIVFLALFSFLVVVVIPPIVREVEALATKLPTYVKDFSDWASNNEQFRELNDKYDITKLLTEQASQIPSKIGDAAGAAGEVTVGLLNNLVEAVVVLTLTYFLLLDGRSQFTRITARLRPADRDRSRRLGARVARIVRSYVSVNLLLALLAGLFTWVSLEILGVDLAVPLAVLVAFFDLVPLIGFTVGGVLVAIVCALDSFPTSVIIWLVLFIVYQQLQDRVIQPLFYKSAVRVQPAVAVIVVLAGAQLAGILGALLAIPVAAALAAVFDELFPKPEDPQREADDPAGSGSGSDPGSSGAPAPGVAGSPASG